MNNNYILWRRLDHAGHESARLFYQDDSWNLQGTAVFSYEELPCRLDYRVVCDSRWHTRAASVIGWVGNNQIEIVIDASQQWSLNDKEISEVPDASISI